MYQDLQQYERTILIIDDDVEICELLTMFLTLESYRVLYANSGMQGIDILRTENIDIVLLDIGLPDVSGQQICKMIRKEGDTPIIMVSANDSVSDKIICLEYGADDYVTKPFENMELTARIKAVLRRIDKKRNDERTSSETLLSFHGMKINLVHRQAIDENGDPLALTPKEFDLLVYFCKNQGSTLSRERIVEDLWGKNTLYHWSRSLDVHIQNLRQKVEINPKNPSIIQTVSGIGYKIQQSPNSTPN